MDPEPSIDVLQSYRKAFKALGDPTRLGIVQFLAGICCGRASINKEGGVAGPTAGQICCHITGSEKITSTVSKHLRELEAAGLVLVERRGRFMVCTLQIERLRAMSEFLAQMSTENLDDLCKVE